MVGNPIWGLECGSWLVVRKNKNVGLRPESKDATSTWNFGKTQVGKMKSSTLELSKNPRPNASIIEEYKTEQSTLGTAEFIA